MMNFVSRLGNDTLGGRMRRLACHCPFQVLDFGAAQVASSQPTPHVSKTQFGTCRVIGGTLWLLPCVKKGNPKCPFTSFSIISELGSTWPLNKWLLRT